METSANAARPVPCAPLLESLSDAELLADTRRLVGRSNQVLAHLLAHLGEVEARGIHRTRACSSLYTYCIYELRFSEDEAFRRVAASRLVKRFPGLHDALASGELHLTGLLLLGPHLTERNLAEVLARAKHRTKRELAALVRVLDPLPTVPARIEPLGPAPARLVPAAPRWEEFIQSMCPVRELSPGDRPRDWVESANDACAAACASHDGDLVSDDSVHAPARVDTTGAEPLAPERYKVQFTASEEYVRLIEAAKGLLSHSAPRVTLEEIQFRAMRALVSELTKKKYGAVRTPNPRQRGRHIPAAVRRAVFERDGNRCTYVDEHGMRCAETHRLEFHHLKPFATGGGHTPPNLTMRCRSHNTLAAEEDFGREVIQNKKRPH
jgi:hypothetical protein